MHSDGSFEGSDYPQKASVREARDPPGTPTFRPFGCPIINFPERRIRTIDPFLNSRIPGNCCGFSYPEVHRATIITATSGAQYAHCQRRKFP